MSCLGALLSGSDTAGFREALNYGAEGEEFNASSAPVCISGAARVDTNAWSVGHLRLLLTALGLARASDLFAAGVDIHGCTTGTSPSHFSRLTIPRPRSRRRGALRGRRAHIATFSLTLL